MDAMLQEFLVTYTTAAEGARERAIRAGLAALRGDAVARDENLLTLKGVAIAVGYHPSTLWRLGVPEHCNEGFGGRPRYRLSRVLEYLRSEECQRHRAIMRAERLARRKKENGNECGI